MEKRRLGNSELYVNPVGLGCMGFSHASGDPMEKGAAVKTIREAYEIGYDFFDTAEVYTGVYADGTISYNEELVGEALKGVRDQVVIATKMGVHHNEDLTLRMDSRPEIIQKIKEMGIVGMGGACFPTHVKLMPPKDAKAEYLLLNGVECEPYLTCDYRLMLDHAEEIMIGAQILMKALNVSQAIVGIEANKPKAIAHMSEKAKKFPGISVQALKMKYPQGAEKQLIKALTGRAVPSGKLPINVGCVVDNVATCYAVYQAVQKNMPLVQRIVTVTGPSVPQPTNFLARLGTPVSAFLEAIGGVPEDTGKVISGGPMMGKALANTEVSSVKGMSGILVLPEKQAHRNTVYPCIRCGKCVDACPMGLEPYLIASTSLAKAFDLTEKARVMDCIECGCCHFTCPSNRPLLDAIKLGKSTVGKIIRARNAKN